MTTVPLGHSFSAMGRLSLGALAPLLLFLFLPGSGCSPAGPDGDPDPFLRLAEAGTRWTANRPDAYELALRRSCGECLPAGALAVIVSVTPEGTTVSLARTGERIEGGALYPDVDGLFQLIETYLLAGAAVDVDYDAALGHPRTIAIDPVPDAVDDEFGYAIDGLVVGRHAQLRAALAERRERWETRRILDYQLTLSRSCFCPPEGAGLVVLTVFDGEPAEWQYFLSGDPVSPEWRDAFPAVEGLFDFAIDAIERGAETIDVRFDEELGLPVSIRVDYRQALADEEIGYEVEKIVDLGGGPGPNPIEALDDAAVAAARSLRYSPPSAEGISTPVWTRAAMRF